MDMIMKEIVKRIKEEANPDKIILFGSRARGKTKEWSDYDICVLVAKGVNLKELEKRLYLKLYGTKAAVDIIAESTDGFDRVKHNPYLIYHEIEKHGKIIYEK